MERRILASVLLIYSLVGWVQMYSRMEMYTKLDPIYREGHDVFWGHVALVGETVNISCRMNNPNQAMWKGQMKVVNSSRVTVVRDHPILRAMIRNVSREDSGSYRCVGSDINLRVTDISQDNPPTIKGCTCGTYNTSDVCSFFTNVKVADTVDWTITYKPISEFELANAVPCDKFFLGDKDGHIVPSCELNETLSNSSGDIQFHINGSNPFVSSFQVLNCSLNSEPVMEDVAIWINQDLSVTTPSHFYISEQKLFFLPPSKRTRHADKDSSRSYIGYIARAGDNITWTCAKMKTFLKEPLYSVSDGNDPRIIQVTDDDWMNTTIVHVSFEDTKKYHCGDDTRWLIVIDAEKQPKINKHSCVLGEKKGSREMKCTFSTNSLLRDHILWTPTFSISSMSGEEGTKRLDSCGSRSCTDIECSTVTRKFNRNNLDELTCILNDVEYDKVYDFSLRAENPFINATLTISQPTNYKIVKLPAPSIQLESITSNNAMIRISCPVGDNFPKSINYKVNSSLLGVQIFAYKSSSALVPLKDLSSYTNYTPNIYCQFAETNNPDVWSEPLAFSFHTTESIPAVGPEVADTSYYIGEPTDECSPPNRVVTLIWKAIPEESGQANGIITDYYIYSHPGQEGPAPSKLLRKVSGEKTSQLMCVGGEEVSFAIAGATAAGLSKKYNVLRVLDSDSEIDVKPCHVTAELRTKPERVELNWNTFSNHRSDQFVVFWCRQNSDGGCLAGTLKWRAVGRATGWVVNGSLNDYKFGIEVHNSHMPSSSGIVWAQCLSYPEKELQAADIQVDVDELEAKVNLIKTCQKGSRTASSYSVKFCPYDEKTDRCTTEVREHRLLPCDQSRVIKLDKFSTDYSFWLVSYAGSLQATSNKKVVRTTNNPLPMSGIVGLSALVLVATVALTALFVWFRRQKKMARTLRRPQLVKPFRLGLESEVYATDDVKENIDIYSAAALHNSSAIIKVDADEGSMCESVTSKDKLAANEYVTKGSMNDPDLNKCNTHLPDYDKHHPLSSFKDYQKHWADLNTDTSSAELPDDYLKHTCNASGPNLSTQLFYSDTSNTGGIIDLAKFVQDSGPTQPPPSYKSSTMEYIKLESCNPEQDFSDDDEDFRHNSRECDGFLCETDYTDLSSPDCSGGLSLSFEEH